MKASALALLVGSVGLVCASVSDIAGPKKARAFGSVHDWNSGSLHKRGAAAILALEQSPVAANNTRTLMSTPTADKNHTKDESPSAVVNATEPDVHNITALYYLNEGRMSACATYNKDSDLIFAVPTTLWDVSNGVPNPQFCGKKVKVIRTDTGASITATCLENAGKAEYAGLSKAAFSALEKNLDVGMIPIQYYFLDSSTGNASDNATSSGHAGEAASTQSPVETGSTSVQKSSTTIRQLVTLTPSTTQAPTTTKSDNRSYLSSVSRSKAEAASAAAEQASASSASSAEAAAASNSQAAKLAAQAKQSEEAAAAKSSADAAWASRSSSAAPEAASPKAASQNNGAASGGSGLGKLITGGFATFFYQNNNAGNCGIVHKDTDRVIAVETSMYDNGKNCGRKIRLTRTSTGESTVGTVQDSCPTCTNSNSLDLSVSLFNDLANEDVGMFPITWQWVD